jgi:hypothetical protein
MNEEETAARLRARQEKAVKKTRGKGITLLEKKTVDIHDSECENTDPIEAYTVVATENAGLRTIKDVKDYMVENDIVGVVYPVRMGKAIERSVQTVVKFT